jgi:hypothetical protein
LFGLFAGNESACFSPPIGEEGECVNIRLCPAILALLRESPRKPDTVQKVQAAQCGVEGTVPKVIILSLIFK